MIALQLAVGPGMKGGCQDVLDAHGDQIVVAPAHHSEVGGVRGPHLVGARGLAVVLLARSKSHLRPLHQTLPTEELREAHWQAESLLRELDSISVPASAPLDERVNATSSGAYQQYLLR